MYIVKFSNKLKKLKIAILLAILFIISIILFNNFESSNIQAAKDKRKNIVFIQTDDQTFEQLKVMKFTNSRKDWVRFDNAIINHPLCCPSRASTLKGQYSHHTGVQDLISGHKFKPKSTIGTWLKHGGYKTAFLGKYLNGYPHWGRKGNHVPPGWDQWLVFMDHNRKYPNNKYNKYFMNINGKKVYKGTKARDYADDFITNQAIQFIKRQKRSKNPFYVQVNLKSPHAPYTPPKRHKGKHTNTPISHSPNFNEADVSDKPQWIRDREPVNHEYMDRSIRSQYELLQTADDTVRRIFVTLKKTRQLHNTVVVFMSDNGNSNGSHRYGAKRCAYEECIKVPLLIRYPGIKGKRVDALVSNVDLAPTFAHIARVRPWSRIDGKSLMPTIRYGKPVRTEVLIRNKFAPNDPFDNSIYPSFWGLRTTNWKYVELSTGEKELYYLKNDPYELNNLADNSNYANQQAYLDKRLDIHKKRPPRKP